LQVFSDAVFGKVMQQLTSFQLTYRGRDTVAELLFVKIVIYP